MPLDGERELGQLVEIPGALGTGREMGGDGLRLRGLEAPVQVERQLLAT